MELSPELAYKLASVLTTAGEDISTLQPINPWAVDTPRAKRIQATVQSLSPELAATLAKNAGGESLAYVALQHQLAQGEDICVSDLPERLQQEVILRNGAELRKEAQARDEAYLQKMESEARKLAEANGRNFDAVAEPQGRWGDWQKQQQAWNQAEQKGRAAHSAEMKARAQQQAQADQMAKSGVNKIYKV